MRSTKVWFINFFFPSFTKKEAKKNVCDCARRTVVLLFFLLSGTMTHARGLLQGCKAARPWGRAAAIANTRRRHETTQRWKPPIRLHDAAAFWTSFLLSASVGSFFIRRQIRKKNNNHHRWCWWGGGDKGDQICKRLKLSGVRAMSMGGGGRGGNSELTINVKAIISLGHRRLWCPFTLPGWTHVTSHDEAKWGWFLQCQTDVVDTQRLKTKHWENPEVATFLKDTLTSLQPEPQQNFSFNLWFKSGIKTSTVFELFKISLNVASYQIIPLVFCHSFFPTVM